MDKTNKAAILADGIYLTTADGNAVLFAGSETPQLSSPCTGIAIKLGSRSLKIGLTEETDSALGVCTLTTKAGGSPKRFKTNHPDATADWDGKGNTEDLSTILNPDINLQAGEWVPSLGEMRFILMHLKEVNEALRHVNGEPLKVYAWYWTSTSYSASYAWYLYLNYGYAYFNTKATYQGRVRPVSAFLL